MVAPIIGRGPDVTGRVNTGPGEVRPAGQVSTEVRVDKQTEIRTPADAINVMRVRMEQRLQEAMGGQSKAVSGADQYAAQAQPPSASDVAGVILGFVQNRLQQETDAGADLETLAGLMEQARAGIEKGYAEAREQIVALGMMNETLGAEIDEGFDLIQDGLLNLEKLFLSEGSEMDSPTDVG
ncbi:DUF5610 domain-containing protein [Marinobacter sp. 1_MG-2023]|uniref:DUF5610 domain-containing protein n=1 Tax=Marinobacter sp. 1_MG-2023 TaxID=3062627 RepID=UPI0026E30D05|nr:DUF5610 domain-containing protein [Marinobacter sp. 1_MG-2023]MDO6823546.1 DUF5610 domain-containing protein [Marinobacter sp. 1_MG-2023]